MTKQKLRDLALYLGSRRPRCLRLRADGTLVHEEAKAVELLKELVCCLEREAVAAEVRLLETQAQRERTERARCNLHQHIQFRGQ